MAYLTLEELLADYTEHWKVIFGPLLVVVAVFWRRRPDGHGPKSWCGACDVGESHPVLRIERCARVRRPHGHRRHHARRAAGRR